MAALVDVQSDSISTGAVHNSTLRPFFYLVTLSVEVRETFRDVIFLLFHHSLVRPTTPLKYCTLII